MKSESCHSSYPISTKESSFTNKQDSILSNNAARAAVLNAFRAHDSNIGFSFDHDQNLSISNPRIALQNEGTSVDR